jgi:2-polyprenyl-3-methyl-5-hydroxy-6-metoxy-1,4-benzoquinol methylase
MVKDKKNIYQTKPADDLCHYHAGNLAQAVKNCGEVLQKYPRNVEAMHLLGVAAIATEQYDSAVRIIKQAILINPGNPVFYSDAGIALQKLNRPEEAAAHYQVALALKPDFTDALDNLALLAKEQGTKDFGPIDRTDPICENSKEGINESLYNTAFAIRQYYTKERIRFFQECFQLLIDKGVLIENKHVVDVACGMGYQLKLFPKYKPASLTGLDLSLVAIEIAKLLCPGGRFYEFNIYEKYNESFDVVICTQALEHFLYPHIALKNILSMINPNGCAFLTVPNGRTDTFSGHLNFWSPESWKVFIETNCKDFEITCGMLSNGNIYALIRSR